MAACPANRASARHQPYPCDGAETPRVSAEVDARFAARFAARLVARSPLVDAADCSDSRAADVTLHDGVALFFEFTGNGFSLVLLVLRDGGLYAGWIAQERVHFFLRVDQPFHVRRYFRGNVQMRRERLARQ